MLQSGFPRKLGRCKGPSIEPPEPTPRRQRYCANLPAIFWEGSNVPTTTIPLTVKPICARMVYGFGGLRVGQSTLRSLDPPDCLQGSYPSLRKSQFLFSLFSISCAHCCAFYGLAFPLNPFVFYRLRTSRDNYRGWGYTNFPGWLGQPLSFTSSPGTNASRMYAGACPERSRGITGNDLTSKPDHRTPPNSRHRAGRRLQSLW